MSAKSQGKYVVSILYFELISSETFFNVFSVLEVRIILKPLFAKEWQISKPIPELAPVTKANFFVKLT